MSLCVLLCLLRHFTGCVIDGECLVLTGPDTTAAGDTTSRQQNGHPHGATSPMSAGQPTASSPDSSQDCLYDRMMRKSPAKIGEGP